VSDKKRILLVSEFSLLNTGFSVMAYDVLSRLHNSGKYEVAELASYVSDDDPRINQLPWKVYPVIPSHSKKEEMERYHREYQTAQFGGLRFESAVNHFKPDIVFSYRDYWHDEFITKSPSRPYYTYIWSACIDSEPPRDEWMATFSTVDLLTSYTQWGLNVLRKYGGGKLNVSNLDTMPGVDIETFKPMDRAKIRAEYGIPQDANIIMTVMRNQPRKLFPSIMSAFANALDNLYSMGLDSIADKTYLYLHTGNPDCGFDIPKEMIRYGIGNRVIVTYYCQTCKQSTPGFYAGDRKYCPKCRAKACAMANTSNGSTREELAKIYNLADLYLQYSVAGALEIPIIEAKACGVPVVSVEYAAPYELARLGGGYGQVKMAGWKQESVRETSQIRGVPDDKHLEEILTSFLQEGSEKRELMRELARDTAEKYHSSDGFAKKWDEIFSSIPNKNPFRWFATPKHSNYINLQSNGAYDAFRACTIASEAFTKGCMQGSPFQMAAISDVMNKNAAFTGNEIDLEKLNNIANKEVFDRNNFEQNRYFSNVKKKTTVQNTGNSKLI
jgi:glycosyltransferase involved in cell wall biosynthesis